LNACNIGGIGRPLDIFPKSGEIGVADFNAASSLIKFRDYTRQ
jgi:hypothetical protein